MCAWHLLRHAIWATTGAAARQQSGPASCALQMQVLRIPAPVPAQHVACHRRMVLRPAGAGDRERRGGTSAGHARRATSKYRLALLTLGCRAGAVLLGKAGPGRQGVSLESLPCPLGRILYAAPPLLPARPRWLLGRSRCLLPDAWPWVQGPACQQQLRSCAANAGSSPRLLVPACPSGLVSLAPCTAPSDAERRAGRAWPGGQADARALTRPPCKVPTCLFALTALRMLPPPAPVQLALIRSPCRAWPTPPCAQATATPPTWRATAPRC